MIIQQILSFFSTPTYINTIDSDLKDIREHKQGDSFRDINRKKVATHDKLMTNEFEDDNRFSWRMILVLGKNTKKWETETMIEKFEKLVYTINKSSQKAQQDKVIWVIHKDPPKENQYIQEKQIIVSDFFREEKEIDVFLQAAQKGLVRWIIPPLLTVFWRYTHPLIKKHPRFFFKREE